jgi:hypothetical protein
MLSLLVAFWIGSLVHAIWRFAIDGPFASADPPATLYAPLLAEHCSLWVLIAIQLLLMTVTIALASLEIQMSRCRIPDDAPLHEPQ